jgi:hypothetical protein
MRSCSLLHAVFRTIEVWYSSQEQLHAKPSDDQLVQLLQKIRVQHCTQPFVATVLGESPLAAKCFSARELRLACICSNAGGAQPKSMITAMDDADCPTLAKFPAWDKPKRPASAVTKLVLEREVGWNWIVCVNTRRTVRALTTQVEVDALSHRKHGVHLKLAPCDALQGLTRAATTLELLLLLLLMEGCIDGALLQRPPPLSTRMCHSSGLHK